MGLVPKFNISEINQRLKEAENQHLNKIIRILKYVGGKAVNEAKTNGNYQDHTANLRNSIGYVLVLDGKIIEEHFTHSTNGKVQSKENPHKYGKKLAYEVAKSSTEISLIVVAGMKYASYVESKKRVVLTSAEQLAKAYLSRILKKLR